MIGMNISKTVLKCSNCDPNSELNKLNPRWGSVGKKKEYRKGFVGIYKTEKFPTDYNEKLNQLICPFCNNKLIDTNFPHEDFNLIGKVTDWNRQVLDLMMELHERESNRPHCSTCGSTNIKKITGTERATSVIGLGIFSNKINKSYKCLKCKSTW